ncbi:M1 family metallopeptidase [Luteimonas sp. e5]
MARSVPAVLALLLAALPCAAAPPAADAQDPRCTPIPLAAADAAAVRTPSAADAWGGPRSGSEPTLSNRVVDYRIHARLDPVKHTIEGRQHLTWTNRSAQPVCTVYLHLYLNAFESAGSTFMSEQRTRGFSFRSGERIGKDEWGYIRLDRVEQAGQRVPWRHVQPDGGPASDKTVVRLDLPTPVSAGASTTLEIDFFDQLPRVIARTGYFGSFHLVAQWFPKIGVLELAGERGATAPRWNVHEMHLHSEFYADFGHYDVSIEVPSDHVVGATGELVEKTSADGRTTWRFVQGDVHDFAWTADSRTAEPLRATWNGPGGDPVEVQVLFPPELADNAPVVLKATLDSLTYFSDTLGRYPYRTVTAVIPPHNAAEAGGMEYPTFFTAIGIPGYRPGGIEQYLLEFVTIHEFGHGYFYGILASNEFEEPMLDEGLNQYWNSRMLRDRGQKIGVGPGRLARWRRLPQLAAFDLDRLGAGLDRPLDPLGANAWNRRSSASYASVYSRSATLFAGIERQIGREAMERAMKLYYERWKFRHPSLADLREALAEGSGRREVIERAFDLHVYGVHRVDDRIELFTSREELPPAGMRDGQGRIIDESARRRAIRAERAKWKRENPRARPGTGGPYPWRTRVVVRRDGADVPQVLRVIFADGSHELVEFSGDQPWFEFSWTRPSRALKVELDPQRLQPLDRNLADNVRSIEPHGEAGAIAGSRMFGWMQWLLAWVLGA